MSGPVGNVYDKYGSKNPIAQALMAGFLGAVNRFVTRCQARSVLEVGCGEGLLSTGLIERTGGAACWAACDLELPLSPRVDRRIQFERASIYDLPHADQSFDLVLCCEVLEHLAEPRRGLAELARVAASHVIVSTPREPLWRMLNVARGKYVSRLGNTPGHVQHFSRSALEALVSEQLRVRSVATPLPWTIVLAQTLRPMQVDLTRT